MLPKTLLQFAVSACVLWDVIYITYHPYTGPFKENSL